MPNPMKLHTQSGNTLVIAALLAIVIIGMASYFLTARSSKEEVTRQLNEVLSEIEANEEVPEVDPASLIPNADLAGEAEPAAADTPNLPTPAKRHPIVVRGNVTNSDGAPISGAIIRWLPTIDLIVGQGLHNSALFNLEDVDNDRLGEGLVYATTKGKHTTTNSAGHYELAFEMAHQAGSIVVWSEGYQPQQNSLELATEAQELQHDFTLQSASSISGTVLTTDGTPAVGMKVAAREVDRTHAAMFSGIRNAVVETRVGRDGQYEIIGLDHGEYDVAPQTGDTEYVSISYSKGSRVDLVEVAKIEEIDFEVSVGGALHITVLDPDGTPLKSQYCGVMSTKAMQRTMTGDVEAIAQIQRLHGITGPDGKTTIRGLPLNDRYYATVNAGEFAPSRSEDVALTTDDPTADIEITRTKGFSVSGITAYENGRAAPKQKVSFSPRPREPHER